MLAGRLLEIPVIGDSRAIELAVRNRAAPDEPFAAAVGGALVLGGYAELLDGRW